MYWWKWSKKKERYWLEFLNAALNTNKPSRTNKEWVKDNKEKISKIKKKYVLKHQEQIKEYRIINKSKTSEQGKKYYALKRDEMIEKNKEKYICSCGLIISYGSKRMHIKRKIHLEKMKKCLDIIV